ncbi:death-inducer obliterator 1-like isoform X2 [Acanthaster planci]|uniref:Death-inducer obliterator 1-like isoform X2 n=1 Tax=Acanthaster planci TaxID=133434 RepID=A0A8B7ZS14_ACAPL|nr:death-inducer obliterator 1-like isoform X2 [Acanthaster planci]
MDKEPAGTDPSSAVISESANVVVQRLSTGSPLWNLTATDGETETEGETKEDASLFNIPSSTSLLTEAQIHQIDCALSVEGPQADPKAGRAQTPELIREGSMEGGAPGKTEENSESQEGFPSGMVSVGSSESLARFVSEENPMLNENDQFSHQLLMNASSDSLKLDIPGVLDLSGESLETRQLLEEVMNSELLEGVIKNECLDGQVAATAVVTTSDGDTSAGEGIKEKGHAGGRKKHSSTEKAIPLRRSERHKKAEQSKVEASQEAQKTVKKTGVKEKEGKVVSRQVDEKKEDNKKDVKKERVLETKDATATRKSQRSKTRLEQEKHAKEEESEDGYEQDKEALGSSESSKEKQHTRRKRSFHKRKQSKGEETDSDLEDGKKTLKEIQEELKSKRQAKALKEGHQVMQEVPDTSKVGPKPADAHKKETRRRSEDAQHARSDHTYERRRSGSTSEQGPSLFTPDNAVFIKLGTPRDGEGERRNRSSERRKERTRSWSELRSQDIEEGDLSSDGIGEDDDNDSDWTSGDDPEKLWCICRKPHDNRFMICCDQCEEWYHGSCVDITKTEGKRLNREKLQWICPVCIEKAKRESKREMKSAKAGETTNPPAEKPIDKPAPQPTPEKAAKESADVKGEEADISKPESKEGTEKSPEPPHSTKKKRLKFYKPPPPKQHCIGPGCQSWARPGSIYCSSDCIVRHARQSIRMIHQEKEKSLGTKWRRDSTGSVGNKNILSPTSHKHEPERIPVLERHTGKVRTGLSAPIQEQLYDFLERHPSYEVLRPGMQHGVAAFYSSKSKPTKDKKEEQIEARVREREREEQRQRDSKLEQKTNPHKDPSRDGEKAKEKAPVKEKASVSKEKASTSREKAPSKEKTPNKEQPEKSKRSEEQAKESVRRNVRESLRDMLGTRVKGAKDLKDYEDQVKKKAYMIEYELYRLYNDTGSKYKSRYRSLFFNIKDSKNQGLFRRILKGEISAAKLVRMSSEQLASKELAQWREREAKHSLEMIVHEEVERKSLPLTKKTHKGEVEINDDNLSSLEAHDKETKPTIDMKIIEKNVPSATNPLDNMLVDTTTQHRAHLFDLNCKICTGKMPAPREEDSLTLAKKAKVARTTFPEDEEGEGPSSSPSGGGELTAEDEKATGEQMSPMETEDSEPFSQPDDGPSPQPSPIAPSPKEQAPIRRPPPSLWNGSITMEEVAKFAMAGFHVSGPIRTISMDMPENIVICGRIPYPVVWDYFKQLRKANTTDLIVLRFHVVQEEDKSAYITLFQYFHSRQRIGVVGNNRTHIKDMYILPLSAHEPVPQEIMPFKGPGLAEPRPHMLLGLLVRHRERARSASLGHTPRSSISHHDSQLHPKPQPPPQQQKRRLSDTHTLSTASRSPTDPEEFLNNPEEHGFGPKRFRPSQEPLLIPKKQLMDPIVAQYANADPTELTAEPYSPTQEEIEAPYDPADVLDVIGEVPKAKGQTSGEESSKEGSMQSPTKLTSLLQESGQSMSASEIANAASDVTANLLTAFSSKPNLTEQQQLLIKLTQQVEDAKKALLDRQIASLQSEIEKATSDSDFSPGHSSVSTPRQPIAVVGGSTSQLQVPEGTAEDQTGSPQIRRAPADSSTAAADDQGGATPTKDEPESKDAETKAEPGSTNQDRSALDFIQATLFEPKTIPSVTAKVSTPTPPPIGRIPIINVTDKEPSPPFQGSYEPKFTPPPTAPTYNPSPYGYDQGQQRAPFGEQLYNPDQSYNPSHPASPVEEYQPIEEPKWQGTRDYDHGQPGPSGTTYSRQDYDPYPYSGDIDYRPHSHGQQEPYADRQGYDSYGRDYNPHNRGRGHGWGQRDENQDSRGYSKGRSYDNGREQEWRHQTRDYGHGYPRY